MTGNRLLGRLLWWGVTMGALVGGGTGLISELFAATGGAPPALAVGGLVYGVIIGAIVALLPSLLGGLFVSVVIEGRIRGRQTRTR